MHISLPEQLENMVKERVKSGMYGSASEVVREALREFFGVSRPESPVSPEEAAAIKDIVSPRLEAVRNGTAELIPFEEAMEQIHAEVFDNDKV